MRFKDLPNSTINKFTEVGFQAAAIAYAKHMMGFIPEHATPEQRAAFEVPLANMQRMFEVEVMALMPIMEEIEK